MNDLTICILTYGEYPHLARRVISSISRCRPHCSYQLVVGGNAVGAETAQYLADCHRAGEIDRLELSDSNLNKCPMMRRMFGGLTTDFIWWFDDDSYVLDPQAVNRWLKAAQSAPEHTVMWGMAAVCEDPIAFAPDLDNAVQFVRTAAWYRGLPPPSWKPGGKGELDYMKRGSGDGRWFFILGGCWLIRTRAVLALGWPDKRLVKMGDDVFLGEAIRQQGWTLGQIDDPGIAINTQPRRGNPGVTRLARPIPDEMKA